MDPSRGTGNRDRPVLDDCTEITDGPHRPSTNQHENATGPSRHRSFRATSDAGLETTGLSWVTVSHGPQSFKDPRLLRASRRAVMLDYPRNRTMPESRQPRSTNTKVRRNPYPHATRISSQSALETPCAQVPPDTQADNSVERLVTSICGGDVAMVRASLDAGAIVNAAEHHYIFALRAAPSPSQSEIVQLLVERRVDGLWELLQNAIQSGYADLVKVMLDVGVDESMCRDAPKAWRLTAWRTLKDERDHRTQYDGVIEDFVRARRESGSIIMFSIEWELHQFIREQLDGDCDLSNTLTVTGDLEVAYATTCEQYVQDEWGYVGLKVLELVSCLKQSTEVSCPLMRILPLKNDKPMGSHLVQVLDIDNAVPIIQVIAWVAMIFRLPDPGRPHRSLLDFNVRNQWLLRIGLRSLGPEITKASHGCWHDLLPNTNIAIGFPRGKYAAPGLQLPLNLIFDLTDAIHRTDLEDLNLHPKMSEASSGQTFPPKGVFYNGVDSVIFPVKKIFKDGKTFVLWHFDNSRTIPPPEWNWIYGEEDFATAIHVLGFTPEADVHLGTPDRQEQYGRMSSTSALEERSRTDLELDGLSMTLGRPPFQFAASGRVKYTRGQRVIINAEDRTYDNIIRVAEKQSLILYDHGLKKIGWLVPQLSVILDLVHFQAYRENWSIPAFAKLQSNGGAAAADVLRHFEVANCTLYSSSDDGSDFKVKHLVKEIYVAMSKRRNADDISAHSTARFRDRMLRGWDLLELLEPPDQSFRREFAIHTPSWLPLTERVPVYFGDNLGDIITSRLRSCCLKIWHDERLLVASVHALSNLHRMTRDCGDFHLECGLVWECRKTKATISPRCRQHHGTHSDDEIRRMFHESVQVFANGRSHTCNICIKDLSAIRHDGAVVFGSKANLATALWNSLINGND